MTAPYVLSIAQQAQAAEAVGIKRLIRLHLIALALTLTAFSGFSADFFVVLLKGSEILTGLRELTFFHTLTDVPVDERTLGVHKIKLVVETGKDLSDCSRVRDHAASALDLGQITTGDNSRGLVVDTALETSGRPVDKLNGTLGLDGCYSCVNILWYYITTVHQTACHVFSVARIALGHHGAWFEGCVGDFSNRELFVVCFLSRDNWSVRGKHKVDTWVWYQVGLELGYINVKSTIEAKGCSKRGDNLSDQTVQVGVGWALDIKRATADIVDSFVIKHNCNIGVLKKRVGRKNAIVWFYNSSGYLWGWVYTESELGLASVVYGKALKKKGTKTGSGTSANSVEAKEALKTGTVISKLADAVKNQIYNLFADGVVTTSVVVSSIFFASDDLLWVVKRAVSSSANFVTYRRFKINQNSTRNVFACSSFCKERVESIIASSDRFVRRHLTVRLDTVFHAVQLPARVTELYTSLAKMN
jgi:hypothetical protein